MNNFKVWNADDGTWMNSEKYAYNLDELHTQFLNKQVKVVEIEYEEVCVDFVSLNTTTGLQHKQEKTLQPVKTNNIVQAKPIYEN